MPKGCRPTPLAAARALAALQLRALADARGSRAVRMSAIRITDGAAAYARGEAAASLADAPGAPQLDAVFVAPGDEIHVDHESGFLKCAVPTRAPGRHAAADGHSLALANQGPRHAAGGGAAACHYMRRHGAGDQAGFGEAAEEQVWRARCTHPAAVRSDAARCPPPGTALRQEMLSWAASPRRACRASRPAHGLGLR